MLNVALTGGIGAGKSTVAEIFATLGAVIIDSDELSREAIERGGHGYDRVIARFGDSILSDGDIDRSKLAAIIFDDESARKDLEAIIHPIVREMATRIMNRVGENRVVINQIPLLVETNRASRFDLVITVEADLEIRRERLRDRGMKDYEITKRIAAQTNSEAREAIADVVITNNGSLDDLTRNVETLWERELLPRVNS